MVTLMKTDKLERIRLANNTPTYLYDICPYCGQSYRYIENALYRPKDCGDYRCVRRSLHSNIILR